MTRPAGLSRHASLVRYTPLQGGQPPARKTRLRAQSAKRRRENRERRQMVAALWPDGRPRCAIPWCPRLADDVHEPLSRARGGSITDPANTIPLCRPCHTLITDTEPSWAYEHGLLKHSWEAS